MIKNKKIGGFTLIELLIVIAILGTLAVVVLIALNPVQQLARTRDAGRISGVTQLGHATEAYGVTHGNLYPSLNGSTCPTATNWAECLVEAGEINIVPGEINDATSTGVCVQGVQNATWCYDTAASRASAIVYARFESDSSNSKCTSSGSPVAFAVYSSMDGRGGTVCTDGSDPTARSGPGMAFVD